MKRLALLLALPLALAGCVTIRVVDDGVSRARIGEAVVRDGVRIMPLAVLEDSRCPQGVACIQAGTVRVAAEVDGQRTELTLARPVGRVTLVEVYPARRKDTTYYPDEYRLGFRVSRWQQHRSSRASASAAALQLLALLEVVPRLRSGGTEFSPR